MIIKSLRINNFRLFQDRQLFFSSGLNIVIGPNEAGKSTLVSALKHALYTDPVSKSKMIAADISGWDEGDSRKAEIEIEFEAEGINYVFEKNFLSKETFLKAKNENRWQYKGKEALEKIVEIYGIPNVEMFETSASLNHEDLEKVRKSTTFVAALQNASTQGSRDGRIQDILRQIDLEIQNLRRGMVALAKNPGLIRSAMDDLKRLEIEKEEKGVRWKEQQGLIEKYKQLVTRKDGLEVKEKELARIIDVSETYYRKQKEYNEINTQRTELEERIEKIEEIEGEYKKIANELLAFESEKRQSYLETQKILTEYEKEIDSLNNSVAVLKGKKRETILKKAKEQQLFLKGLGITLGLSGIVASVKYWEFIFLGLGGVVMFLLAVKIQKIYEKFLRVNEDSQIEGLREQILQENTKIEMALSKIDMVTIQELDHTIHEYEKKLVRKEEKGNALTGLLGNENLEKLKQKKSTLAQEAEGIRAVYLTEEIKMGVLDTRALSVDRGNYAQVRRELEDVRADIARLEGRLGVEQISLEEISETEDRYDLAKEKYKNSKNKLAVLTLLSDMLGEATQDTTVLVAHAVREIVEKYIKVITEGKYTRARLDRELELEVYSPEKNDWINPMKYLSSGACDQIFFLVRYGYFKLLSNGKRPFLVLDDAFLAFDSIRMKSAMELLKVLAEENQIIYLTHRKNLAKYGDTLYLCEWYR